MSQFDQSITYDPLAMPIGSRQRQPETQHGCYSLLGLFNLMEDLPAQNSSITEGPASPTSSGSPVLGPELYGFGVPEDDWMSWPSPVASPVIKADLQEQATPRDGNTSLSQEGVARQVPSSSSMGAETIPRYQPRNLKRKSGSSSCASADDDDDDDDDHGVACSLDIQHSTARRYSASGSMIRRGTPGSPPKKVAHNMIEKRYRNKLNDKIAELRDAVPALRVVAHRLAGQADSNVADDHEGEEVRPGKRRAGARKSAIMTLDGDVDSGEERLEGLNSLEPAHKLNKATILSKATEYIGHLEQQNQGLSRENTALRGQVTGLERLIMAGSPVPLGIGNVVSAWS